MNPAAPAEFRRKIEKRTKGDLKIKLSTTWQKQRKVKEVLQLQYKVKEEKTVKVMLQYILYHQEEITQSKFTTDSKPYSAIFFLNKEGWAGVGDLWRK